MAEISIETILSNLLGLQAQGGEDEMAEILKAIQGEISEQADTIINVILPGVIFTFLRKNADYGDTSFELGAKGQFAEIWRKVGKLKRAMWDEEEMAFEQAPEIISDLIGHCLLALYFYHKEEDNG